MALQPGTRIGPYEIKSLLGAGGMGEVYLAHDARLGRDVALKVLPAQYASDPDRLRRFEIEARAASQLNHPNILTVFDVGTDGGQPYVVAERLEGETLRDRLGRGPIGRARGARDRAAGGAGTGGRPRARDRPSRSQARESVSHQRRPRQDSRLRPRQADERRIGIRLDGRDRLRDRAGRHRRHRAVHGARAGERAAGRSADGSVRVRRGAVRDAHRQGRVRAPVARRVGERRPQRHATGGGCERPATSPLLARVVEHCLEKAPEQRFQSARDLIFALDSAGARSSAASGPAPAIVVPPRRGIPASRLCRRRRRARTGARLVDWSRDGALRRRADLQADAAVRRVGRDRVLTGPVARRQVARVHGRDAGSHRRLGEVSQRRRGSEPDSQFSRPARVSEERHRRPRHLAGWHADFVSRRSPGRAPVAVVDVRDWRTTWGRAAEVDQGRGGAMVSRRPEAPLCQPEWIVGRQLAGLRRERRARAYGRTARRRHPPSLAGMVGRRPVDLLHPQRRDAEHGALGDLPRSDSRAAAPRPSCRRRVGPSTRGPQGWQRVARTARTRPVPSWRCGGCRSRGRRFA